MTYTDRDGLLILEFEKETDTLTFDELICALKKQPSNTAYVEVDGALYGLVTSGNIIRAHENGECAVEINKAFSYVGLGEIAKTRKIFQNDARINALPVVGPDRRLLGEYTRWNDLTGTKYAKLQMYTGRIDVNIGRRIPVALVKSVSEKKQEICQWWKHLLEERGLQVSVIEGERIAEQIDTVEYILFIEENERRGWEVVCTLQGEDTKGKLLTCGKFVDLLFSSNITAILRSLQARGVNVLVVDLLENENKYLAALFKKIEKKFQKYGETPHLELLPAMKKDFFGELYCAERVEYEFSEEMPKHGRNGTCVFEDVNNQYLHISSNERLTVGQPAVYDRCIYMYGPCTVFGQYVEDGHTVASFLQDLLNRAGHSCKVLNYGMPNRWEGDLSRVARLLNTPLRCGDIVIFDEENLDNLTYTDVPFLNLTDALEEEQVSENWMIDNPGHCNHKVNRIYAQAIYDRLLPMLSYSAKNRELAAEIRSVIEELYLKQYFFPYKASKRRNVGAIVMNCNPFTFGHRYLIEQARKQVNKLIIFVVEEDRSYFTFEERFAMVREGVSDLEGVRVVPSGPFILSHMTFPEYFTKTIDANLVKNTENDIICFAESIAPQLGINVRFVGEELEDPVTEAYNQAMKRILPAYDIRLVEIPRKRIEGDVISASSVRRCLESGEFEKLEGLVPDSTKRILFRGMYSEL